jgi:hypothetical protein
MPVSEQPAQASLEGSRAVRSAVPVAIAGDPALAVGVYETVCDALVRRASTPHGNASSLPDEIWFGIITRQAIRRGTFSSVKVLIGQIRDYITHWNTNPKPFAWTATAGEILAKVRIIQTTIKKLVNNNAK